MGLATYDDLKAAVADWLDREDLAGRTGDFITLAEARLNRLMGFSGLTARVTLEAGPGEVELAAPADLRDVLALVRTADGTAQGFRFEPGRLVLNPPPAAAVSLELTYRARPQLSEARPVNVVLAEHPDLYLFGALAEAVAIAPPIRPAPLTQDELLNLFSAESTGKDFVLTPATDADMRGKDAVVRASLEVVYDNA